MTEFNTKSATFANLWISKVSLQSQHCVISIRKYVKLKMTYTTDPAKIYPEIRHFVYSLNKNSRV